MLVFLIHLLLIIGFSWLGFSLFFPVSGIGLAIILSLLIIVGALILSTVLLFVYFVGFFWILRKQSPQNMARHHLLNAYSRYIYNVLLRVKVHVVGSENIPKSKPFVIYSNHIEYSDPVYIHQVFHAFPVAFISKESLFKTKLTKLVLSGIGCIPISRVADRSALNSIVEGIKVVKSGQPMGIFPEGKRTYSHDMIDFKAGSFKLATKANAPIIPVCLSNMHETLRKHRIKIAHVTLTILPAITHEQYDSLDTQALADMVRDQINACSKS
jgi:1-acyl-sn-glycerol-3-phosphate acyltransferase